MPYATGISHHPLPTHAAGEVIGQVLDSLAERPDVAIIFVTGAYAGAMEDIAGAVRTLLRPRMLIGSTATGVLAGRHEAEVEDALVLFVASWSGRLRRGRARTLHLDARREGDGWRLTGDHQLVGESGTLLLLADPESFPTAGFLDVLATRSPDLTVIGGLASAARGAGANRLVCDDRVGAAGAVGLLLPPGLPASPVVSQGCRPLGRPLVVTRASGNLIDEIAGRPALEQLMHLAETVAPADRSLMAQGVQIGLGAGDVDPEPGDDYLIRPVLGADRARGAVAVGAEVEVGTTVQFHVRDRDTADQDLRAALAGVDADAALVFTCTGRGLGFFGVPDHDAAAVSDQVEDGPVAGMFCAGEVGPVRGRPHLHGFSTSMLLFG